MTNLETRVEDTKEPSRIGKILKQIFIPGYAALEVSKVMTESRYIGHQDWNDTSPDPQLPHMALANAVMIDLLKLTAYGLGVYAAYRTFTGK